MSNDKIKQFKSMVKKGNDNALLHYSLGNEYMKEKNSRKAVEHLKQAIMMDDNYSAAWKLYGKALTANEEIDLAIEAYKKGIAVAEKNGDKQAAKEMAVFLKRINNTK